MDTSTFKYYKSHGDGKFSLSDFRSHGENIIFENGVLIFHPENITLGSNIYVGHNTIIKGYYKNKIEIHDNTWIGQCCFFHGAGGIIIGKAIGVGPFVKIITSNHMDENLSKPILYNEVEFKKVILKDGCDIGVGSVILPGVTIGEGAIIGAGSVVTKNIPTNEIWAGNPAHYLRKV